MVFEQKNLVVELNLEVIEPFCILFFYFNFSDLTDPQLGLDPEKGK